MLRRVTTSFKYTLRRSIMSVIAESKGESCGCEGSSTKYEILTPEQITEEMATLLKYWELTTDGKHIQRHFACKHWKAAIAVINAISDIAERPDMQHHPDLSLTSYRNLDLKMTTNSVNALTRTDFLLAREIDKIAVEYSPKWLKSQASNETGSA